VRTDLNIKYNSRPAKIILMRNSAKAIGTMREFPAHRKTQFPPSLSPYVSISLYGRGLETGDWRLVKSTTGSTQTALLILFIMTNLNVCP
jgi:hypothetical protein